MLPAQTPSSATPPAPAASIPHAPTPPEPPDPILPPGITKDLADRILSHYLADISTTAEIAEILRLPVRTIGLILETDYARGVCDLIERLNLRRAQVLAGEHRIRALASTARLAESAKREETRRLAASSLLRLVPFTPPPAAAAAAPSSSKPASSPSLPARTERSLLSALTSALTRSIRADVDALAPRDEEPDHHDRAPAAQRPSPAPPRADLVAPASLLDNLAARMAAPPSSAVPPPAQRPPHQRSRDSPKAA